MGSKAKNPCRFEGCSELTSGYFGYCYKHSPAALPCKEPGCPNRCAVYTKRGYCKDHRVLAERLRRKVVRE